MFYTQPDPLAYAILAIVIGGLVASMVLGSVRGVVLSFVLFVAFIFQRVFRTDPTAEGLQIAAMIALLVGFIALIVFVPAGYGARMVRTRKKQSEAMKRDM